MDLFSRSFKNFLFALFAFHFSLLSLAQANALSTYGIVDTRPLVVEVNDLAEVQTEFSKQAEDEFNAGVSLFKKADYKSAAAVFEKVAKGFAPHQRTTAALIMKAKAEVYGGNITEAEKTLQGFFTSHPTSTYLADAHFTLGLLHLKKEEHEKACASFLDALRSAGASAPLLQEETLAMLDETIDQHIAEPTLQRFAAAAKQPVEEEYLGVKIAEKQFMGGNRTAASSKIESLRQKFPRPTFAQRLAVLDEKLKQPTQLKLGVLFSAAENGPKAREKEVGEGLLEGIEAAVAEYLGKVSVVLEVRSSQSNVVAAARELASDGSVVAIIGPAFSAAAQEVASVASEQRIPIVTPTANANGIAAGSEFMFQANPDLATRARAIAQHAVLNMKLKRLGILGSSEPSSKMLAEAFTKEVERFGSEVIVTEWYPRGTTNLLKQLTNLRRKGNAAASEPFVSFNESMTKTELVKFTKLGVSMKVLDTLKAHRSVVNMTEFLGEDAESQLNAHGIHYSNGDPRIDSVQRVVTAIQGLYCPISSAEEISIITSQLAFYGIRTKLLGSGEWNNAQELNANRRYCRGVVFESDYHVDTKSAAFAGFSGRLVRQHNKVPSKYAVLGYDTAKLLLSLMQQGAATREQMKDALVRVSDAEGLHAKFNFRRARVNSWLHIFEFTNDGINRIGQISVE